MQAGLIEADPERLAEFDVAKNVAEILCETYPGYLWMTSCRDGAAWFTTAEVAENPFLKTTTGKNAYNYQQVIHHYKAASSSELRHKVIMAGGEFLERLGLPRSRSKGIAPKVMEV